MIQVDQRDDFAVVTLAREPVNTMNYDMWMALLSTLEQLEEDGRVRGIIFQSGLKRDVFTAGNDIMELYAPNTSLEKYRKFWILSNTFLIRLYASPLVTVCAVRGACPAGGCCLALCCDYRVMTERGSIGLNEVALGISVPKYWGMLMQRTIGVGPAEKLLQCASMLDPAQAKSLGLIDQIAAPDALLDVSVDVMKRALKAPDSGRAETKRLLREDFVASWKTYLHDEANYAWELLSRPETVTKLRSVLEQLGRNSDRGKNNPKNKDSSLRKAHAESRL